MDTTERKDATTLTREFIALGRELGLSGTDLLEYAQKNVADVQDRTERAEKRDLEREKEITKREEEATKRKAEEEATKREEEVTKREEEATKRKIEEEATKRAEGEVKHTMIEERQGARRENPWGGVRPSFTGRAF